MTGAIERLRVGSKHCLCVPGVKSALEEIYARGGWVYDELAASPGRVMLRGRKPVIKGALGSETIVVKRLSHGGFLAGLTGDRFLTAARFRNHFKVYHHLTAHGIPSPEVLFAGWVRDGIFYRGEIGVRFLPRGRDVSRYLFQYPEKPPENWRMCMRKTARLVADLEKAGVHHPDLNLMNFFYTSDGRIWLLDLDKATLGRAGRKPGASHRHSSALRRLIRSVKKQGRAASPEFVTAIIEELTRAYGECYA